MCPQPRLNGTEGGDQGHEIWLVYESVPVQGYLPAYQQRHSIRFKLGDPAPCTCCCPHFTSTRLPCSAICTVLAMKNIQTVPDIVKYIDGMWLVENHPCFPLATHSSVDQAAITSTSVHSAFQHDVNAVISRTNREALQQMELPTDLSGRHQVLTQAFNQILPNTAASAVLSRDLFMVLTQHRCRMTQSQSVILPPPCQISQTQATSGSGPAHAIVNLASVRPYKRSAKQRVSTAKLKDPACYTVHKTGAPGAVVRCLCGQSHVNDKKAADAHRKTPAHQSWKNSYLNDHSNAAQCDAVDAVVPEVVDCNDADDAAAPEGIECHDISAGQKYCLQHCCNYENDCQLCKEYPNVHIRGDNVGFATSPCLEGNHCGMYEDCDGCQIRADEIRNELASGPLCVVMTGTFPRLGGGAGLKVGKERLKQMILQTQHGRVVSALSSKTTHLVTGMNPGQAKLEKARQQFPFMNVVTYEEFVCTIKSKQKTPPTLPTKREIQEIKSKRLRELEAGVSRNLERERMWSVEHPPQRLLASPRVY